jgi:hypothetical protein
MEAQKPQIEKKFLSKKKKSNSGGIMILAFKLHYRAMVTKTAWY